jgi:hypothetical protein
MLAAAIVLVVCVSTAGGRSSGKPASVSAAAFALRDEKGVTTGFVRISRDGTKAGEGTSVRASTGNYVAAATARATATEVALFGDLVTAKRVAVSARASGKRTTT